MSAVLFEPYRHKKTRKAFVNQPCGSFSVFIRPVGGGDGGSRTPVRKTYVLGTTCLVFLLVNLLLSERQDSNKRVRYCFAVHPRTRFPRYPNVNDLPNPCP